MRESTRMADKYFKVEWNGFPYKHSYGISAEPRVKAIENLDPEPQSIHHLPAGCAKCASRQMSLCQNVLMSDPQLRSNFRLEAACDLGGLQQTRCPPALLQCPLCDFLYLCILYFAFMQCSLWSTFLLCNKYVSVFSQLLDGPGNHSPMPQRSIYIRNGCQTTLLISVFQFFTFLTSNCHSGSGTSAKAVSAHPNLGAVVLIDRCPKQFNSKFEFRQKLNQFNIWFNNGCNRPTQPCCSGDLQQRPSQCTHFLLRIVIFDR